MSTPNRRKLAVFIFPVALFVAAYASAQGDDAEQPARANTAHLIESDSPPPAS